MIEVKTDKKSPGINLCDYIILHHTGGGTFKGNLTYLSVNEAQASAHYVIGSEGEVGKIGNDTDILWHAGISEWKGKEKNNSMNYCSIGIEIVGPGFTDIQRDAVNKLVIELSKKYSIPKENILRHKDIAPIRKTDVDDSFWKNKFSSYEEYINSLFNKPNKPVMTNKYKDIFENVIKETGYTPIFGSHEGENTLNEAEIKTLIDIAIARYGQKRIK